MSNTTFWESGWSLDSGLCPTPFLCPRGQAGLVGSEYEPWTLQGTYLVANSSGQRTMGLVLWLRVRLNLFAHQSTDLSSAVLSVTTESSVKFGQSFHTCGYNLRPRVPHHLPGTTSRHMKLESESRTSKPRHPHPPWLTKDVVFKLCWCFPTDRRPSESLLPLSWLLQVEAQELQGVET